MNPKQFFEAFSKLKEHLKERICNNQFLAEHVMDGYNDWSYHVHDDSIVVTCQRPFRGEYDEMFDCEFSLEDLQSDDSIDERITHRYKEGRSNEWFWGR